LHYSLNSVSGNALLFFREPVRKHAQIFSRIRVAVLEHLSIISNSSIFYITINPTLIYGSTPAELNDLEIPFILEFCLKIFLYLQEDSRSFCGRILLPPD
jgi:hypothetical protein